MKRIHTHIKRGLAVLLLLSLCACGKQSERASASKTSVRPEVTADEAACAILESQGYKDLTVLTGDTLTDYLTGQYGLEEGAWTDAAVYIASGVDAREIAVLRLNGAEEASDAAAALEKHRLDRQGDFFGYAPEQAALLEQSAVVQREDWAALLACADPDGAETALSACLWGETAPVTETPPAASEGIALDTSGFIPFDPPNEHDMSIYDTSAILAAYASGDESGLSEKDAVILKHCREALDQCLTEGMTDFEKELALHDWLLDQGEYDWTTYDYDTPQGQEDNTNPYGMLEKGYGICLGYAVTFQLLMDLAGVECTVVVGAAFHSTEDHAWNMVKLEGEWYCVDPTWDDVEIDFDVPDEVKDSMYHSFFNVTSEGMRQSNHQWDYQNVPEATATRFFWDGTGDLPT